MSHRHLECSRKREQEVQSFDVGMCLADPGIHKVSVSRVKPEESCRQEGSRGSREDILL